jgi:hypothetical protein
MVEGGNLMIDDLSGIMLIKVEIEDLLVRRQSHGGSERIEIITM